MSKPSDCLSVILKQEAPIQLDVALTCGMGEMLAIIGPSGSGKSTVLRTIAGLSTPDYGLVKCGEEQWLDTKSKINQRVQSRQVGFVFQHYALFPHKTALENVSIAVKGSKSSKAAIAKQWLDKTNMTGLEDRKPAQLSGGQRQRVALARALATNPRALLLDEPFSAVDQQTRRRLYRELAKLRNGLNIPILLVTHDMQEVQQLADSLCLIHRGKTLQQGAVQSVINAPATKAIAKLLGHQNLISATVDLHDQQLTRYRLNSQTSLWGKRINEPIGRQVTLLISPSAISISNPEENSQNQQNTLFCTVRDAVGMGDEWSFRMHLTNVTKSLRFRLANHQVAVQTVSAGSEQILSILPGGVHAIIENDSTNA